MRIFDLLTLKNRKAIKTLKADEVTEGSVAYDIKQSSDAIKGVGYTEGSLKTHEDRLDTLEADVATEGSVLKSIKDNAENATFTPAVGSGIASTILKDAVNEVGTDVEALKTDKADQTALESVKVKTTENDLAIQAIQRDQTLANQSEAKISASDYGIVALPKNATGNLKMKREGLTARNIVSGASIAIGGTVTFASVLNDIYYDTLHKVQITGTGSDIVVNNDSGAIANMAVINLTQTFSSIPTLAQCKNIFPTYFADTKSVPMTGRYRGVGKNLWNQTLEIGSMTSATGANTVTTNDFRNVWYQLVTPSTQYIGSVSGYRWYDVYYYTKDKEYISNQNASGTTLTFITPSNCGYIRVRFRRSDGGVILASDLSLALPQLELGSTATTYAPFEAHDQYLTAPDGRSVPSAKDSVEVQDGELVHVKRISTSVAVGSGVAVNVTNYPLAKTGGNFRVELTAGGVQIGVIGTDSTSGAGTLTYELATPITTPIDQDGAIQAGASVYWEPAIPDVGIYTTKFDILDTTHPIASIDKLYKVDFATGVQTLLTDAVVAGDGLSFTSASLTDGDLVNVIYFYSVANPEGLTTVEYLNSNVVVADSANGKYYKYKPVITNGAIASWTLTEVV
jgi:hypothetical protein